MILILNKLATPFNGCFSQNSTLINMTALSVVKFPELDNFIVYSTDYFIAYASSSQSIL